MSNATKHRRRYYASANVTKTHYAIHKFLHKQICTYLKALAPRRWCADERWGPLDGGQFSDGLAGLARSNYPNPKQLIGARRMAIKFPVFHC